MSTTITIKKSLTTAAPSALANGELAYSANGDSFYIGSNGAVVAIGGRRTPGILTANQAIVANSTSFVDQIKTAVLTIDTKSISTINSVSNATHLGTSSNNELVTSWAIKNYVDTAVIGGAGASTFAELTDTSITSVVNNNMLVYDGAAAKWVNKALGNGLSFISHNLGVVAGNTQLISNTSGVWANQSNFDHNSLTNYDANQHVDHSTVSITAGNGLSGGGTIATTRTLNVVAGNTQLISNSTGLWANQAAINHNSLQNYVSNQHIDHSTVSITAGNGLTGGGTIAATRTLTVLAGNSQLISNSTGLWANQAAFNHNSLGGYVSNQHVDHSAVSITAGNGLTGGGTIASTRSLAVVGGTGVTANSTGVHIGQAVGTTDNVTFANVVATSMTTGDLTVSGNLDVNGTLTTVDSVNLSVTDPIIQLARGNSTNVVDIGLYGVYNDGTDRYTGLVYDSSAAVFELFANTTVEPTTTIDTAGIGFTTASLKAYLKSGGLTSNSSVVNITANSTVSVALVANTMSLSTALPIGSGGTGRASFTANRVLVGNTSSISEVSGSNYQVLQINSSGNIVFGDLDGGTF